jgi:hypothetical protein
VALSKYEFTRARVETLTLQTNTYVDTLVNAVAIGCHALLGVSCLIHVMAIIDNIAIIDGIAKMWIS